MNLYSEQPGPIGVFDSGYGGLTILEDIRRQMPEIMPVLPMERALLR